MDEETVERIVQDFLRNLEEIEGSQFEISEGMVREMISLAGKKQFDPNLDELLSGMRLILGRHGLRSKV